MRILIYLNVLLILSTYVSGQTVTKKPFPSSDYETWQITEKQIISNDGKCISYELNPQKGDGTLIIEFPGSRSKKQIARGKDADISFNSNYSVFKIRQPDDSIRKAKIAKVKPEKMPKDSLGIYLFENDSLIKIPNVKSFKMAEKDSDWMVYHHDETEIKPDTSQKNDTIVKIKPSENDKKSKSDKKKPKGTDLVIFNPITQFSLTSKYATEYFISKNGKLITWIDQIPGDKTDTSRVFCFTTDKMRQYEVFRDTGTIKGVVSDEQGKQIAFIQSSDTSKAKRYRLFYVDQPGKKPVITIDTVHSSMPKGWSVSEFSTLKFSESGKRLFFGIAPNPLPEIKDTVPDEDKVKLDIWNWKDPLLQSQQNNQLKDEEKRTYLCFLDIPEMSMNQIADPELPKVYPGKTGDNRYIYGLSDLPYQQLKSWDKTYNDVYIIDTKTGLKKRIIEKQGSTVLMSPNGDFLIWYNLNDSSWYSYQIDNSIALRITKNDVSRFYDDENDVPDIPGNYGFGGFTNETDEVLIYDKYDIWLVDLKGEKLSENLTNENNKGQKIRFRYIKLDKDEEFINLKKTLLIKSFDLISKESGFFSLEVKNKPQLTKLLTGNYTFPILIKAKNSNNLVWSKGNFNVFPDIYFSNSEFSDIQQITNLNLQKEKYSWGNVELVSWQSFDGNEMNGLLYTPENMDTTKKYPMIVYFYEKYSDDLHRFYNPSPSRSTVNFSVYTSNGYIVFVPDITYKEGLPGKSAYDDVISGTLQMCKKPFVDQNKLAIQGQSWGGYQVAWLVTQTNLFKAAMAGAPVSNMTSAYGGIRWESGMSRMFQYEKSQSRIGVTLWDNPLSYIQNSPLFYADKVETPLLIMHNDADGAVPWYQGIEYFTALRRLGKPSWMLVYNGEEHNLTKWYNRVDLSIRMMQFFDHYLKDEPEPLWMKEGVPAIKKGKMSGFEINY